MNMTSTTKRRSLLVLLLCSASLPNAANSFAAFPDDNRSKKRPIATPNAVSVSSSLSVPELSPLPGTSFKRKRESMPASSLPVKSRAILPLLEAIRLPQSKQNRVKVELLIEELSAKAIKNKSTMKRPIQSGSYRTVWSTVTADSLIGTILRKPPSNVLGGPSWQIISKDKTEAENIVYWDFCDVRMAGLARLSPLPSPNDGYSLSICGLGFRWGANGCPEKDQAKNDSKQGKVATLFYLDEDTTLGNGVGTLRLLYNDGNVRITRDEIQNNTYVHVKEPFNEAFEAFFSPI